MGEESKLVHVREDISDLVEQRGDKIQISGPNTRGSDGSIPVLSAWGSSLAEAWENSLLALYHFGGDIRTDYDQKDKSGNFIDPPSVDCTMRMIVMNPFSEPVIHRCFPGGLDALEEYRQEVIDGIKDCFVRDQNDPNDKRWEYTYHQRLFNFTVPGLIGRTFDQIEYIVDDLKRSPISRRAQAVTWKVWEDEGIQDPACLQSVWCRAMPDKDGNYNLNMNVRFRSRDAYEAAFMNCFALVHLMSGIAKRLSDKLGVPVNLGRFVDESDSYHIYGHKVADFKDRFLKQVKQRTFEDRTWTMEFAEPMFEEARPRIAEKISGMKRSYVIEKVTESGLLTKNVELAL